MIKWYDSSQTVKRWSYYDVLFGGLWVTELLISKLESSEVQVIRVNPICLIWPSVPNQVHISKTLRLMSFLPFDSVQYEYLVPPSSLCIYVVENSVIIRLCLFTLKNNWDFKVDGEEITNFVQFLGTNYN